MYNVNKTIKVYMQDVQELERPDRLNNFCSNHLIYSLTFFFYL